MRCDVGLVAGEKETSYLLAVDELKCNGCFIGRYYGCSSVCNVSYTIEGSLL